MQMRLTGAAAAVAAIGMAAPAAADPWVYLGNHHSTDGENPLMIDEASIKTENGVTTAVARYNLAVAPYEGLVILEYPFEANCAAKTFKYTAYRYVRANGEVSGVSERFMGKAEALKDKAEDKRLFDYACKVNRKGTKLGGYDYAAIKKKYGGKAAD